MSRLASNGIYASEVIITGAESVVIGRKGYVIKSEEFISCCAEQEIAKFQKIHRSADGNRRGCPKNLSLMGPGDDVKLIARLAVTGIAKSGACNRGGNAKWQRSVCARSCVQCPV